MLEIIPAILTNDPVEARDMMLAAENTVNRVQIDVIDGVFAQNKTVDPTIFEEAETQLLLDYHLMVREPINWMEKCLRGQADRIIGQVEMMGSQEAFVQKGVELGVKVGLALDIDTPVSVIEEHILKDIDVILVMSVKAGFGGQEFDDKALDKIQMLHGLKDGDPNPFVICDDGGITLDRVDDVRRKGVDEVAIGKRLFEGNLNENIQKFLQAAYK